MSGGRREFVYDFKVIGMCPPSCIRATPLAGVFPCWWVGALRSRLYKSTTTATMVGGPKEFGGTKGCFFVFLKGDIIFLKTQIDQEMTIGEM